MSTAVWSPMRAELRRCILSVAGIPDMRFEELPPRDPIVGVPFIVDKLEKGEPSMGATDLVREDGIYHANLWWPRAQAKDGEDLADKTSPTAGCPLTRTALRSSSAPSSARPTSCKRTG